MGVPFLQYDSSLTLWGTGVLADPNSEKLSFCCRRSGRRDRELGGIASKVKKLVAGVARSCTSTGADLAGVVRRKTAMLR